MKLRYNKGLSIALVAVGALLALTGIAFRDNALNLIAGLLFVVVGGLMLKSPIAVIEDGELRVKNPLGMTLRKFPVSGPADLRLDGNRVIHVATGKKTVSLGFGINNADAAQWRQWIGQATPAGQ